MSPFHWYATCQGIGLALGVSEEIWKIWAGQWRNGDCRSSERRQKTKKNPCVPQRGRVTSATTCCCLALVWGECLCVCELCLQLSYPFFTNWNLVLVLDWCGCQFHVSSAGKMNRFAFPRPELFWQPRHYVTPYISAFLYNTHASVRVSASAAPGFVRLYWNPNTTSNLRNFNEECLVCNFTNEISFLQLLKVQQQTAERQQATNRVLAHSAVRVKISFKISLNWSKIKCWVQFKWYNTSTNILWITVFY